MSFGPWLHAGSLAAFVRPWCQGQALQGCAAGRAARGAPRCIPALATAASCSCLPPLPRPYGHRAAELCFLLFLRFRLLRIKAPHPGLVSCARSWSEDGRRGLGKPILSLAASPQPALLGEGNPPGTRHGPALPPAPPRSSVSPGFELFRGWERRSSEPSPDHPLPSSRPGCPLAVTAASPPVVFLVLLVPVCCCARCSLGKPSAHSPVAPCSSEITAEGHCGLGLGLGAVLESSPERSRCCFCHVSLS